MNRHTPRIGRIYLYVLAALGGLLALAWPLLGHAGAFSQPFQASQDVPILALWQEESMPTALDDGNGTVPPPNSEDAVSQVVFLPLVLKQPRLYLPLIKYDAFDNTYPSDGATDQSLNVFLAWALPNSVLPGPTYTVYLEANDPTPDVLVAKNTARTSFDPSTFDLDTQYYWQVVAVGANGRTISSLIWTFRTEKKQNPPAVGTMVTVPAGPFLMGCDPGNRWEYPCRNDEFHGESPLHTVYLDAFEIDKYEVTNRQYRACVEAGVCALPRRTDSLHRKTYFYDPNYDYYPVIFVSWQMAQSYCAWDGKRLPAEAEWEKAARGPIDTRVWPWGNEPLDCSRVGVIDLDTCRDSNPRVPETRQVGAYPRNESPYGALDMAGNVFEWVNDKYNVFYYAQSPSSNPTGPTVSIHNRFFPSDKRDFYTIRGGSNFEPWYYLRVAHRHYGHHGDKPNTDPPLYRTFRVGFRCARSLP